MTFPFTPCRSCLNHTHCPDKQKWKRVIFLCHETVVKSNNRSRSFSLFSQKLPFDVVHQLLDLQHKPHTNFCKQHFQNLHALVSLDLYDYWDSFFAQVEIEDVVFNVNWNESFSSVPTHLFFEVYPHCLANFAVLKNHETTARSQIEILMSFCNQFLPHGTKLCVHP